VKSLWQKRDHQSSGNTNTRVSELDGGERWKHKRVPFPFCFFSETHTRFLILVETHPKVLKVGRDFV